MLVLGIESSCDETAAAVIDSQGQIQASVVHSQDAIHADFGGVVPELASREHLERIHPVVEAAFRQAKIEAGQLEGIVATYGPGLIGSLLVGASFAKSLALVWSLPFVGVNHLEGHLMAPFIEGPEPMYPFVGLVVSGGHTSLYLAEGLGQYQVLGSTRDDAAGEAFDKVAKLMDLGYPGGIHIDRLAQGGDPDSIAFPRGMARHAGFDFSFSGLKTAVLNRIRDSKVSDRAEDLASSFQQAVVDSLAMKTMKAVRKSKVRRLVVSGGVAANSALRKRFERVCEQMGVELCIPPLKYCTDNAAMIAWVGQQRLVRGQRDSLELKVDPRLRLAETGSRTGN